MSVRNIVSGYTFFSRHNPTGRNAVILASDLLREHIRKEYPTLKIVSSILKITNGGGKGKLDTYKRLADEYDEVMVHPDDVLNYDLLEQIEDKERHILLINEYCIRNCPIRPGSRFYLSWGTREAYGLKDPTREDRSSRTYKWNRQAAAILAEKNAETKLYCQVEGRHCEADWEKQNPIYMDYLWK